MKSWRCLFKCCSQSLFTFYKQRNNKNLKKKIWQQRLNKQHSSFILLQYVKSCENTGALKIRMLIQKWFQPIATELRSIGSYYYVLCTGLWLEVTYKTSIVGRPREFSDSASDVFQLPPHNSFVKDFETGDFFSRAKKQNFNFKNQGKAM